MEPSTIITSGKAFALLNIPLVLLDMKQGKLTIKGGIMLNDGLQFFEPVIRSLRSGTDAESFEVKIDLECCDDRSWKALFGIMKELKLLVHTGKRVDVTWYYSDDEPQILEMGNAFNTLFEMDFCYERRDAIQLAG